jgi:hypothetical protein
VKSALSNKHFWAGVVVGYLLLVVFPQFNVRSMGVKATVGRA